MSKKIFLCTAGDSKYFDVPIFKMCLKSYSKNTQVKTRVFLVEDEDSKVNTYGIQKILCPWSEIRAKNSNRCIQHGEFVEVFKEANDDDIIIFTDGDIVLQRDFTEQEIQMLLSLNEGEFMANYNLHKDSRMSELFGRWFADPNRLFEYCNKYYGVTFEELKSFKEMNTGVLVGHKSDFRKLHQLYSRSYEQLKPIISGFWNQQFLINLIINKHFSYKDLSYQFHSHIHHSKRTPDRGCEFDHSHSNGVPSRVYLEDGKFKIYGETILFAHKFHQ